MKNNYIKKTIQLIFFAFVAKGLGFVREMVLANYYGANYVSDVFVVVQNIPAVIFAMFGTAVTTGFIPLYSELKVKNGKSEAHKFMNNVFNIFFLSESSCLEVIASPVLQFSKNFSDLFFNNRIGF